MMDLIAKNPFTLVFQDKALAWYRTKVFEPVLQASQNLRQEFEDKHIGESITEVKSIAEDIARKHNVKGPVRKKINMILLILLGVVFGVIITFSFIPELAVIADYITYPALFMMCIIPQTLQQVYMKKWNKFVNIVMPELEPLITGPAANLQSFAQTLIYDIRDKLIANNFPLQAIQFDLQSNQYQGLKIVNQSMAENRPVYKFQLAYPPGMEPLAPTAVPVEDTNTKDEFASFLIKEFEGEHIKDYTFNYVPKENYDKVNGLLDASDFTDSKQAVEFVEEVNGFNLKCKCGEPLVFKDCQLCNWGKGTDFHFFFATGQKCKCNEVTYLFCADPKDVPNELKDVFI